MLFILHDIIGGANQALVTPIVRILKNFGLDPPIEFVKLGKNSIFLKNGKTVICSCSIGRNLEIFYISDDKTNFVVKFVSRNLVTLSNFVEFLDSMNFTFFEVTGVGGAT